MFYSDDYNIEIQQNKNVKAWLNSKGDSIFFQPQNDFIGLDIVSFKLGNKYYEIPFKLNKSIKYLFSYKPEPTDKEVNLFGQFNSWNRQNLPMKDLNKDPWGRPNILEPGRRDHVEVPLLR